MADAIDRQIANKINSYIAQTHISTGEDGLVLIQRTFQSIRDDRQRSCLNDVVTVSAEHYLFARYMVGSYFTSLAPLCAMGFPTYDLAKAIVGEDYMPRAANSCSASQYDGHHTRWKELGVMDGEWDARLPQTAARRTVKPGWFR